MPNDNLRHEAPLVLSVSAAARRLGVSRSHLYALRDAGELRFAKLLGKTVVTAAELDRLVASLDAQAASNGEAA